MDAAGSFTSTGLPSRSSNFWKYSGCSAQSVPSLSKVAIHSAGGTKSGPPSFVTFATNSTLAFFAAPSFHELIFTYSETFVVPFVHTALAVRARTSS